jgi:hypothetical protein
MSYCSICNAVEHYHVAGTHAIPQPYCPKCQPKEVTILPLDVGSDFDIDETEIGDLEADVDRLSQIPGYANKLDQFGNPVSGASGATGAAPPAIVFANDVNTGMYSSSANKISISAGGKPAATISVKDDSGVTSLELDGARVLTVGEELPDTAEEGAIWFRADSGTAHVFDGEEWQNLGSALRELKKFRPVTGPDAKCDRRAAIKATKAKNDAE